MLFFYPQLKPVFHVLRAQPAVVKFGEDAFAVVQNSVNAVPEYPMLLVMPKMLGVML